MISSKDKLTRARREGFTQPFLTKKKLSGAERAGFTLTELGFVVAIITIFILILTPLINKTRNKARIIACEENLQKIALGLKLYAGENDGKFPATLGELAEEDYVADAKEPDYHYITGHTILSPSDTAIAFDKAGSHKNGKHVLYISGDIVWRKK